MIWPGIAILAGLGSVFLAVALLRFRSMLARQGMLANVKIVMRDREPTLGQLATQRHRTAKL